MRKLLFTCVPFLFAFYSFAQSPGKFNGLDMNMANLSKLSDARTQSISPENFTGEKGKGGMADPVKQKGQRNVANAAERARDLGLGWKVNPFISIDPGTIVDGVKGKGHYVGTYMAVGVNNNGWWGEGEIKFFMDGDKDFATIVGTGTEDYFCGSYNFENKKTKQYEEFSTAYAGMHQVIRPDGLYNAQQRFGMYRWHIPDPIRFNKELKVTIHDLGLRHAGRYLPQQSDIITVAYWYQREPHARFPKLPAKDGLEVN